MQIDLWTLSIQAVNFLVLVWLLNRLLYRPVKAVIDRRQELAERALRDAEEAARKHEAARASLEAQQAELESQRTQMLNEFHAELQAERADILRKTKREAEEIIAEARAQAEREKSKTLANLRDEIAFLAAEMAERIMSGEQAAHPGSADPHRVDEVLSEMERDGRRQPGQDLGDKIDRITVVTAAPLDESEKAEWTAMLQRRFGPGAQIGFENDPGILGGVMLRFPHSVLDLGWARHLQDLAETLRKTSDAG